MSLPISIGFFGGTGMAYGVYSSQWPVEERVPAKWVNREALFIILIFIPLIIFRESLTYEYFMKRLGEIVNLESAATVSTSVVGIVLLLMALILCWKLKDGNYQKKDIKLFFFSYLAVYIFISYIVNGIFVGRAELNHHLYILNFILIWFLVRKERQAMFEIVTNRINIKKWSVIFIMIIIFMAVLTLITINSHGEMGGSHNRFPVS